MRNTGEVKRIEQPIKNPKELPQSSPVISTPTAKVAPTREL